MGVMGERLPPGMEDDDEADLGAQMPGVGGNGLECLGRRLEQDGVDLGLVLEGDLGEACRQGEDDMEIGHWQQLGLPLGQPFGPRQPLALGTMPVAARVVGDAAIGAGVTGLDMTAERRRATGFDRRHHAALDAPHLRAMGTPVRLAMMAEDVIAVARPPGGADRGGSAWC